MRCDGMFVELELFDVTNPLQFAIMVDFGLRFEYFHFQIMFAGGFCNIV